MNEEIFRKKSIDNLSSPDELNEYIKVTSPGVWLLLGAIIVLLVGVCVWGVLGKMETKVSTVAVSEGNTITCYVKEDNISSMEEGMKVLIGDDEYTISSISEEPISIKNNEISEYALHIGDLSVGEWTYEVTLDGTIKEGVYEANVIVDSVSPFYFVFN